MNYKIMYRGFGILAFLIALVTYLLTVQPTVPFWDCGEFSAASVWQQVPHPPGAPLFLMIGKLFHIIIPFGDQGWRINLVSVVSSSLTVWLLYIISVKVIFNFRDKKPESTSDALALYGSAFVGALALIFSDTFWFNAVESEVYALSSLFVAVIVYLMMRWNEQADKPGHERYLLLIAYLMGLSTGVHLLAILAIFSIVFLVYFRKYEFQLKTFIATGIVSVLIFFVLYPGMVKWIPALLAGHLPFKNECHEYLVSGNIISYFVVAVVLAAAYGLYYGYKNKISLLNLICASFLLMILGYSTYTQILLRSNANPPMNENEPNNLQALTSYLGREQYGDAPNWPRRYHSNDPYYTRHYTKKDENGDFIYGPWYPPERVEATCNDGRSITTTEFKKTNFGGEITFLLKYQIYHMYIRYFLWNYMGRASDVQDAPASLFGKEESKKLNYSSGYADEFPVHFFALPLIFGLIGIFYHFYRDPKMAFVYMTMFLMMGVLTAIAQNQQEPQPRERDYFYAGSFFVFCFWIGLGVYGIIKTIADSQEKQAPAAWVTAAVILISTIFVPLNMAYGGWDIHSRAGNYMPFDYSYNILQSTEENAIIFTNGDNDTFPLWYIQDVAGVRRDVRVVNLSLGNTLWYIDQLKNREPWGAEKLPLSFADDSLNVSETDPGALSYDFGYARNVSIPVRKEILAEFTNDPAIIEKGRVDFQFVGKEYTENEGKQLYLFRVQDKLILDILRQVKYERPIYYSITVGPDAFCGLDKFFRHEGMAMRICPVPQKRNTINPEVMEQCLMNTDNSNDFSKTPHYGFKFRNLNAPEVYYDEVHRRLTSTYRSLYMTYANYCLGELNDKDKCINVLNKMNDMISTQQFPLDYELYYQICNIYEEAGAKDELRKYAKEGIDVCMTLINNPDLRPELVYYEVTGRYLGPYRISAYLHQTIGEYDQAIGILQQFLGVCNSFEQQYSQRPGYQKELETIQYNKYDVQVNIEEFKILKIKRDQGLQAALDTAEQIYYQYLNSDNPTLRRFSELIRRRMMDLQKDLPDDSIATVEEGQDLIQ